jgi:hypothetical protein
MIKIQSILLAATLWLAGAFSLYAADEIAIDPDIENSFKQHANLLNPAEKQLLLQELPDIR